MTFDPTSVEVTCVTLPKDNCVQVPWEYINVCGSGLISKVVKTYFDRKAVKTGQNWFKSVKTWSKPRTQEHVPGVVKELF